MRTLAAVVLCLGVMAVAMAQDDTALRLKLPAGAAWRVEQKTTVTSTDASTSDVAGVVSAKQRSGSTRTLDVDLRIDGVRDESGTPSAVRMTWKSVKLQPAGSGAHPLEGSVVLLERKAGAVRARSEKGNATDGDLAALSGADIEPTENLLPPGAIRASSSWEISAERTAAAHVLLTVGLWPEAGTVSDEDGDDEGGDASDDDDDDSGDEDGADVDEIVKKAMAQANEAVKKAQGATAAAEQATAGIRASVPLKATVRGIDGDMVTIDYAGKQSDRQDGGVVAGGVTVGGSPETSREVSATLIFDVRSGRPQRLEWTLKHRSRSVGGVKTGQVVVGGASDHMDTTTVIRTWSETK